MPDAFGVGVKVALRIRRLGRAWIGAPGRAGTADPVFADGAFGLTGSADATKRLVFEVDGLSSGATRTLAAPDADTTLVGTDSAQVLTNKTLRAAAANASAVVAGGISGQAVPQVVLQTDSGDELLRLHGDGKLNTWVGRRAGAADTTGQLRTAVGYLALQDNATGGGNAAVGFGALVNTNFSNTTGLGAGSAVTGDHQVQLGDSRTTAFYYQLQ